MGPTEQEIVEAERLLNAALESCLREVRDIAELLRLDERVERLERAIDELKKRIN